MTRCAAAYLAKHLAASFHKMGMPATAATATWIPTTASTTADIHATSSTQSTVPNIHNPITTLAIFILVISIYPLLTYAIYELSMPPVLAGEGHLLLSEQVVLPGARNLQVEIENTFRFFRRLRLPQPCPRIILQDWRRGPSKTGGYAGRGQLLDALLRPRAAATSLRKGMRPRRGSTRCYWTVKGKSGWIATTHRDAISTYQTVSSAR